MAYAACNCMIFCIGEIIQLGFRPVIVELGFLYRLRSRVLNAAPLPSGCRFLAYTGRGITMGDGPLLR